MQLVVPAYAKLNLTLDVLGRRPDGYHQIASVMQSVSLHDLLAAEVAPQPSFEATGIPVAGENLVVAALRRLEARIGRRLPMRVRLHKRIPPGAGLGGGSADAAAALRAAVRLWSLSIPASELIAVATEVGQDVPFQLHGGTSLATGRGSELEALPALPGDWTFLVARLPVAVSTSRVYAAVDGTHPAGELSGPAVEALRARRPLSPDHFGNDLEPAARACYPDLDKAAAQLHRLAPGAVMTGSGGAFFLGFSRPEPARVALAALEGAGLALWLCRPVPAWE